jgi:hypothetical protein
MIVCAHAKLLTFFFHLSTCVSMVLEAMSMTPIPIIISRQALGPCTHLLPDI